ncbi:MAG: hypothetical protein JXQ75_07475 [Phycisphaerae bacterium]|nr:hypothetical protein [Phycisphaerae bacterium]
MVSLNSQDNRATCPKRICGICWGLLLAAFVGGAICASAGAEDPPKKKPVTTTKPAKEDKEASKESGQEEKAASEGPVKEDKGSSQEPAKDRKETSDKPAEKKEDASDALEEARRKAMASIGKHGAAKQDAPTTQEAAKEEVAKKESSKKEPVKGTTAEGKAGKGAPPQGEAPKGEAAREADPPPRREAKDESGKAGARDVSPGAGGAESKGAGNIEKSPEVSPQTRRSATAVAPERRDDTSRAGPRVVGPKHVGGKSVAGVKERGGVRRSAAKKLSSPDRQSPSRDRKLGGQEPRRKLRPLKGAEPKMPVQADSAEDEADETSLAPLTDTSTTMIKFEVTASNPEDCLYRFDYDRTPWSDVLADFSRMSGLSWLSEPDPPVSGDVTFRSPRDFTYKEAMRQLNELLLARVLDKYLIQRRENYLEIKRLADWMRDIPPEKMFSDFDAMEATNPDDFDIVLVYIDVPEGWTGYDVIEAFRPMFSDTYGTQVRGDKIELTGLVREHRRWRDVIGRMVKIGPQEGPPQDDMRVTLTIPLKSVRAADAQTTLKQLYPVSAPVRVGKRGTGPGIDHNQDMNNKIEIVPDIQNNRLLIKAARHKAAEIAQMVENLDSGSPPAPPQMKVIRLEHASAADVQAQLKPIFQSQQASTGGGKRGAGPWVPEEIERALDRDIIAEPGSNSVILIGSPEGIASAEQLVKERDVPDSNWVNEIIELQHAKADHIAAMVTGAVSSGVRGPGGKIVAGGREREIVPRTSTTLLVSCGKHELPEIRELVAKLDVPQDDEAVEHLVRLQAATPSVIAPILQQLFAESNAPRVTPRKGQPSRPPIGARTRFIPVDATGHLIVYCSDEEWERAEPLIEELDKQEQGSQPVLRTFTLNNADASDVAGMLESMFPPPPMEKGQMPSRQQITADPYHNTVQIFAGADFIEKVSPLIEQLDIQTEELTVIHLQHAKAVDVAPVLTQIFGGRGGAPVVSRPRVKGRPQPASPASSGGSDVSIVAEPITNSLLVTAPPKELERIRDLVAQMDAGAEVARVILEAENRPAAEVAETLQSLMGPAAPSRAVGKPGVVPGASSVGGEGLKILADGNRVILEGTHEDVAKAVQYFDIIDVLDQKPISKKYYVMDAEEDERKLRGLLGSPVAGKPAAGPAGGRRGRSAPPSAPTSSAVQIVADTYENTLLIRAMPSEFVVIDELLTMMLSDPQKIPGLAEEIEPLEGFFVYPLKYVKAFDIAWTLEDLVNTGPKSTIQFDEGPDERILLVRGCKPAQREMVEKYIEMFDIPSGTALPADTLVIETDKMSGEHMMQMILTRYPNPNKRQIRVLDTGFTTGRVQIIDVHEGEEEKEEQKKEQDKKEEEKKDEREPEAVPVSFANPCVLPLSLLNSLPALVLGQSIAAGHDKEPADPPVAAADDEHAGPTAAPAEEPVARPVPNEGRRLQAPPVQAADAPTTAPEDDAGAIKMFVDPFTGKLIVEVPEDEKDFFQNWLDDLTGGKAPTVYCQFPLRYADVSAAAQLLNDIFNQPQARVQRQRTPRQQPAQPGAQGAKGDQRGGRPQPQQPVAPEPVPTRIKVVPDSRTRSLFVVAPLSDIPAISEVLKIYDSPVEGVRTIKFFKLVNLDATQVVENLREILGLGATGRSRRMLPQPRGRGQQPLTPQQQQQMLQMQGQQGQGTMVSSENVKLTAESQTNSIIAQAPPDTLELIGSLIAELEKETNTTRIEMKRVQLVRARATEVATIVKDVAGQMVSGAGPGAGGGGRRGSGRVSVNADARTNSVILAGEVKDLDRVEGIVKDLDVDDGSGSAIKQFAVKGDPRATADTLRALFAGRGTQSDIVITPNDATGVVLVKAPLPLMAEIEKQIVEMDAKVEAEKALRVIKMEYADAEVVARNLQTIFGESGARRGRSGQKINISGNKANKTLYVQCPDDRFEEIKQVALGMDKAPEALQVKPFQLKYASAIAVHKQLETLMMQAARTHGMGDVQLDLIGVLPDARTNSLIVSGGPLTFLLIDQVLAAVDVEPETPVKIETKTYTLARSLNAGDVKRNIDELFRNEDPRTTGVEKPVVTANQAGNVVTVKANKTQHEEILKNIIEPVQTAVGEPLEDYQVKLQYARADEIKPTLEEFMNKWRQSRGNKPQDGFTITADPNSNLLLLNCSPSTKAVFDKQLAELDTEVRKGRDRIVRRYSLRFANLQTVVNAVTQAFRRPGRVSPRDQVDASLDWDTSSVVVLASEENHESVAEMVAAMDVEVAAGGRLTRTFTFKYAEPWQIPRVINEQFRTRSKNPNDQVTASYINGTMSVVVSADELSMEKVAEFIEGVDVPSEDEKITKYMRLKNARADTVANVLNQAHRNSTPRTPTGVYPENYAAEMSTNTLIVTAPQNRFEEIEKTIAELDVVDSGGRVTRTFTLKYAEPWYMPGIINAQFANRFSKNPNDQVNCSYINGTMSVVVTASEDNMQRVATFIEEVDVPSAEGEKITKLFKLKNARADSLANILNQAHHNSTPRPRDGIYPVTYACDMTSNILIVTAPADRFEEIEARVVELDVEDGTRATRTFNVRYVAPWTMANIINQQFRSGSRNPNDQVLASFEDGTMSIIVTANERNMAQVASLIEEADKMPASGMKETRFIKLKNARADELVRPLTEAVQAKTTPDRRGRYPVTITADVASNNLIVTAVMDMFPEIENMVAGLDVDQGDRLRKVFKLTYADPGSVSQMIQNVFRPVGRNPSPRDQVASSDDWTTNSVIVTASEENMAEIEKLLEEMDAPGDEMRTHHVIEVANSNANDVAQSLQQIFDAANRGRRGQRASATIRAIGGTTKLAVYANAEEMKQIETLVQQIDVEGGKIVHAVPMPELVPAKSIAENINKIYGSSRGQDGIRAEFHEPTNTLLVFATDSEFDRINEQVIKVLSERPTIGELKIHKIPLKNAVADEVARTLQDFFDKKAGVQRGGGSRPWWTEQSAEKQLENQVTVIAEPASNMLIVYCTDTTKEMIDDLLADIDSDEPLNERVMRMVALKYMDASEMLDILTEYLKVSKRTKEDTSSNLPWWMRGRGSQNQEEKVVLVGDMRLKAVESSNSIIVVGRPDGVADVLAKIEEMDVEDAQGANEPQTIVLKNANATEMADTLERTFCDPSRTKTRGSSYVAPTIVAVEATNSIMVVAKPQEFNLIKKVAEDLDSEMVDTSGVQLLRVPAGRDVEELARMIEEQINEAEDNKKSVNKNYRPSHVKITADAISSTLLVAGAKAQFEDVERLVNELVARGPAGGRVRQVIPLENMSPEKAKQLIEQLQQGSSGSSSQGSRRTGGGRGRRGDAGWTQHRRYEKSIGCEKGFSHQHVCSCGCLRPGRPPAKAGGSWGQTACAATLPGFLAQVSLSTAIAQTSTTQPAEKAKKTAPVVSKIRPRKKAGQPPSGEQETAQRGRRSPGGHAERVPPMTPEERIRATTQPAGVASLSDSAKNAIQKRLSGAPIDIAEAGPGAIIFEGNAEDLEVVQSILKMLDTAIPEKSIEYVRLESARATDLAQTLQDVFKKIEKVGDRAVQPEDIVDVIADARTNGIYIAATEDKMAQALALIERNEAAAADVTKNVRRFVFENRRVSEAGETLKKMVTSYLKQKKLPVDAIGIEVDPQTNSVFITGGENDLDFVEQLLDGLDAELPDEADLKEGAKRSMQEADIMIVPLRVADANALGGLLNDLLQKAATGDTPMKDFIRRMRILDENGEPIAQIDLNRPIVVFGDPDSNSVVIASSRDNCLIMKQVAKAFDKEPARAEVRHVVMDLEYADATEVAEQLGNLLQESESLTKRPGKSETFGVPEGVSGALVYSAVVKPDARTNQVMIVGRPDSVEIIEGLVKELDVKGLDVMPFEIVKLEFASATALEEALTDMMEKRAEALPKGSGPNAENAEKVIIRGDPRTESLIIAAKPARMEELRGLVKKLDIPASALIENIRTITLKESSATDLADKLKDLWEQRKNQREGGTGSLKLEIPAIVPDERSNSLIVAANKADFDAIKAVVDKIEALELNPMANIYIVRLQYNSAKQLATALSALFQKRAEMRTVDSKPRPEDEVEIQVDEVTNSLLVAASRENYEVLVQKVEELDREIGVPGQVEFFVCDNVGAYRIKETIDELFKDGVFKSGGTGESEIAKERERVTISVDDRSNILIVSASPENMELIREIYKRMNSVTMPWDVAITKLIVIEHGDAVKIAAQVDDYFEKLKDIRQSGGDSGTSKSGFEITVFADERSNRIIVGGTKDGIDSAVEMVRKLDVPPGVPGQIVEVYTLTTAPVAKIGEMIDNVFQERNKSRSGATGPNVEPVKVTVEPNETSNSLLVNATKEDHILIADLIKRLDCPSALLQMVRVFPLEKARAEKLKEIMDELFQAGRAGGTGSSGQTIAVVADKRTNAVVVAAPAGELENIGQLVARLDQADIKVNAEVGIFPCENEDAEKMVDLLNGIMSGDVQGGGAKEDEEIPGVDSMLISFQTEDERGRKLLLETIRENVQITYNVRSNSVVVIAPPSSLRLIEQLVRKLDRIQKRSVVVKVFQLVNADATRMIELLEDMFAYEEGSEQEREFQRGREMQVEGGVSGTGGVPSAASQEGPTRQGTFGRPKTTFVADERTNSIISAGWPEDIDVVADIIDQLDSRTIQERDNVVYTLVNMEAEDMQTALDSYFQAEQARLDRLGDSLSPQRRMDQEVSIVAHKESNQLIISASPRYRSQILSVVEQLDLPPPQVMIRVLIAEVQLDDRFQMGLEFALQELRFSETAVPGGNGVLQSSHFDVVGGTDLGAAGTGVAGFSFTITGEDFNFLVRALQADSRLEIIQRPMIMCQDNQEASIDLGQKVPFVRGTQVTSTGQVTSQVEYEDIGIKLEIEPNINPDGFVYLHVVQEISSIAESTIDIGNGVLAPVFNSRIADTWVAVKDEETVVIGGLIETIESESESKVPFLGDIPGLGVLFRTTSRLKNRRELLIAMTPRIVRTVEDGRRLSIEERDKAGIITDNMKQSPLFERLQVLPEDEQELFDIEAPPDATEPAGRPRRTEPTESKPEKKYGPKAPRYGPLAPAGEDVIARRGRGRATANVAVGP